MGHSHFLRILLISSVLALCFSQGIFGRKIMSFEEEAFVVSLEVLEDVEKNMKIKERVLIQVMDYPDPEPNPRNGRLLSPPPSTKP
ncbi:hypothetical protein AQUCO_00200634v1 [Aquilegia coerulea]|uniref:Neprosin activation peptide domain-containing protein n=1 Tax=Aquilegia coerulea TaxID=218851 RepID=A0A2G5F409_AQUCA|nr:hypothetical protein AQUCO_00200634v1 [Aquilegia coerulea]